MLAGRGMSYPSGPKSSRRSHTHTPAPIVPQPIVPPVLRLDSHRASQPVSQSVCQLASQPVSLPVSQSVSQSVSWPARDAELSDCIV
jgi:hypothetical protein